MRIAVVASGEMGCGVARRLKARGAEVFTSLAGRSAASRERALQAGLCIVDEDSALIERADAFLSIVPPAHALSLARRFALPLARRGRKFLYADCNAVAPATVRAVGEIINNAINNTCVAFVDASIIGGPPRGDEAGPRFYASGTAAPRFAELRQFGLDVRIVDGDIGAASALKLAYAALTKGITALGLLAARGATDHGVGESLTQELAASQPELALWLAGRMPSMYPKAYRFAGEMEEIAHFLGRGGGGAMFEGAALTYREVATAFASESRETLRTFSGVFQAVRERNRVA